MGMPRRIYTYAANMGWSSANLIITLGAFLFAFGILLFIIDIVWSLKRGAKASPNPWDAPTLEWSVPSPPPCYNFAVIPIIASRHPLWEARLDEEATRSTLAEGYLLSEGRETIGSTALDAEPAVILRMPGDSYAHFALGLCSALLFAGLLLHLLVFTSVMAVAVSLAVIGWLWPERIAHG
jgi:cytochrome c oxidase subunit 1/cytochrome c oxidase subunit I+III